MKLLIKITIATLVLSLFSTAIFAQKKTFRKNKKTKKTEIPVVKTPQIADESPQPYFIGSGNEPGWTIEILQGMDASLLTKITTYYGDEEKSETVLTEKIIRFADSERTVFVSKEDKNGKSKYELQFVNEKCTDDADETHDARMILKIGDKELNGCGDYASKMPLEITGKYTLKQLNGKAVKQDNHVLIDVFKKQISANMGCNSMSGFLSINQKNINPIRMASTLMACTDMKLESEFGLAIGLVRTFSYRQNELVLLDEKSNQIMVLIRK
jgi:heat shock protein HslJ/uncharacterized membrane protein